ncbi:hypothetical protein CMK11_21990 [Candidatus Poribacteria bacterium]|nr:hypothetical protein [Candidatus Poribacteria bacterium]
MRTRTITSGVWACRVGLALSLSIVCSTVGPARADTSSPSVFAVVPFGAPSQLLPLVDSGARVRHLSSDWALLEIRADATDRLPTGAAVVAPARPDFLYAWAALPADLGDGARVLWTWRHYGLVGLPLELAWRLPRTRPTHYSAPLGDYAREALADPWRFPAPAAAPAQIDVARRVKAEFDMGRWLATVDALADNDGLRSRFAFRVRDVVVYDGSPPPDAAADVAADWLTRELRSYGYDVGHDTFLHTRFATLNDRFADFNMRNVVADKPGVGAAAHRTLLLTAHYDSIASRTDGWDDGWRDMPAPGANDNAGGVATVLEAARMFASMDFEFTVRFVLFSGEELGLFGSRHFARAAREGGEDIVGVINMDMIGHDADGVFDLHVVANHQSEWLLREAEATVRQFDTSLTLFPKIDPDIVFSDHAPFWGQGYSALVFSEEDALDTPEFSPVYHMSEDTPDSINIAYASETASVIAAVAAAVARPVTGAPPGAAPVEEQVRVMGASAFPNPFVAGLGAPVRVQYQLNRPADVRVDVYAVDGSAVFSSGRDAPAASGQIGLNPPVLWDGRDRNGSKIAPGLYIVHIVATDESGDVSKRALRVFAAADESALEGFGDPLTPGP